MTDMKPRLQAALGQQLVMTPQLRQAIRLLQLSIAELDAELAEAVESNPLLDWAEPGTLGSRMDPAAAGNGQSEPAAADADRQAQPGPDAELAAGPDWIADDGEPWYPRLGPVDGGEDASSELQAQGEDLHDHLLWQLHLSPLPPRDRRIGVALVEAIDDDGYLREPLEAIVETLAPDLAVDADEVQAVLRQVQSFDPAGVGARDLGECLRLQLAALPEDTPGRALALAIADGPLQRLPKVGVEGLAAELGCSLEQAAVAVALLRGLDPRPGAQIGELPTDTYVVPDVVVWRQNGLWRVALASGSRPPITIHRGYEGMIGSASEADASYLRGRLQEARWLLKSLEARGETLLKVMRCLLRQQSAFLEFGEQALRPLTLREVAVEVGLHESTISRAVARKYARTPRGTIPLRAFFASGIETGGGGEASSTAIQAMIRTLIENEDPRRPLSDARLAETLKATGVPVARRTVAKYREALGLPSSHQRVRMG
jgi:RNA polymerase sigma-54 factor